MERRPSVDPALLFGLSLIASLVLWWPTFRGALNGSIDITVAGLRYLAALGLSWLCMFGVGTLVAGYSRAAQPSPPPALPPGPVEHPLRRSEDGELDATPEAEQAEAPAA
jgi:hypothetical protein